MHKLLEKIVAPTLSCFGKKKSIDFKNKKHSTVRVIVFNLCLVMKCFFVHYDAVLVEHLADEWLSSTDGHIIILLFPCLRK